MRQGSRFIGYPAASKEPNFAPKKKPASSSKVLWWTFAALMFIPTVLFFVNKIIP